ncbi:hypothetical protein [Bradyrhizobium sp. 191]|uniref:hypothetical protein n=1 Tax=Bradyrhizobium sp. 191 TaxID=2782659 RepID=UPI001FFE7451|nr:hypothetical protein [Bradyrhizobium sp. 191]UPJ65253.1 hypothetical protein IVB23_35910 [Bradyrhizobium sp. 191]
MARRPDNRRPLLDPNGLSDDFASGCDVQDHEDWLRVVFWVDVPGNGHGARCKVRSLVLPRSALPSVLQELRGGPAHGREARRH